MTNAHNLKQPITVKGSTGTSVAKTGGDIEIGGKLYRDVVVLEDIPKSVLPTKRITDEGGYVIFGPKGAVILDVDGNATMLVPDKDMYRIPVGETKEVQYLEIELAIAKA